MYEDIVKENDNYRVKLVLDEYPEKPYDEGATPILSREFRGYGSTWEEFNDAADGFAALLNRVWNEVPGDGEENIERYLRIFHGAYSVTWDSSEYNRYVSFDTAEWREKVGLTDEYMEKVGKDTLDPSTLSEGSLKEVIAWAEGEVYGIIEERKLNRTVTKVYKDPKTGEEVKREESEGEYWETEEAVWGYYGRDYAEEEAKSIFENNK
ncbi:hypothetical protein PBI_MIMI_307 [Arthrobacter phage Mimi]|nr:hypothetical protein PBI_MIMI_101 [Arthrobacter phage Mimi]